MAGQRRQRLGEHSNSPAGAPPGIARPPPPRNPPTLWPHHSRVLAGAHRRAAARAAAIAANGSASGGASAKWCDGGGPLLLAVLPGAVEKGLVGPNRLDPADSAGWPTSSAPLRRRRRRLTVCQLQPSSPPGARSARLGRCWRSTRQGSRATALNQDQGRGGSVPLRLTLSAFG